MSSAVAISNSDVGYTLVLTRPPIVNQQWITVTVSWNLCAPPFLSAAAQAARPLSCGQNEAYRSDRPQWPERHVDLVLRTQDAAVKPPGCICWSGLHWLTSHTMYWSLSSSSFSVSRKMMIYVYVSVTYISHPKKISVKSTWAGYPAIFCDVKFAVLSKLFRQPTTWSRILLAILGRKCLGHSERWFRTLRGVVCVSWGSLTRREIFLESVRLNTAPGERWRISCNDCPTFVARKSGRGAMVFIDEYEVANQSCLWTWLFRQSASLYHSRLPVQAGGQGARLTSFFGRGVLPGLFEGNHDGIRGFYGGTFNVLIQSNPV